MRKQYVVIGAGRFGSSVAVKLNDLGEEVMVIDRNDENIHALSDRVTHAVQADATDENALKALGVRNFEVAIVAIGSDIQSSILVTLMLKELGIPQIIAKAQSEHHAKVLYKIGADRVILPERDMGIRIANNLVSTSFVDFMELAPDYSIAELKPKDKWLNKTLTDLSLRSKFGVSLMAIKRGSEIIIAIDPDTVISKEDILVFIGHNDDLIKLEKI